MLCSLASGLPATSQYKVAFSVCRETRNSHAQKLLPWIILQCWAHMTKWPLAFHYSPEGYYDFHCKHASDVCTRAATVSITAEGWHRAMCVIQFFMADPHKNLILIVPRPSYGLSTALSS